MANENCLDGIRCPNCHSEEPFRIHGEAEFIVYDNGTEEFRGADWDDDAAITCVRCDKVGTVEDFKK